MTMGEFFRCAFAFVLTAFLAASALHAAEADWTTWRGEDGLGVVVDDDWNPAKLADGPEFQWKKNFGSGHSMVSLVGEHFFTMGSDGSNDILYCLKFDDGSEVWKQSWPCPAGNYPGPRCTPVYDDKKLYTISRDGQLHCVDSAKGKILWKRNVCTEYGAKPPTWGFAGSARVEGKVLLVNAGSYGMALDKSNGAKIWGTGGTGGYATPVVFKYGSRECVAMCGESSVSLVEMKTGKPFYTHPWVTKCNVLAADPVIAGSSMFITSGYGRGCAMISLGKSAVKPAWENTRIAAHFSSPVVIDGYVYGFHGNAGQRDAGLKCLDLMTGEVKWSQALGFGSLMAAAGKLILLTERGDLVIAKAQHSAYEEISRCKAIELGRGDVCWSAPVLVRGRIFCRSTSGQMVCIDVRK